MYIYIYNDDSKKELLPSGTVIWYSLRTGSHGHDEMFQDLLHSGDVNPWLND